MQLKPVPQSVSALQSGPLVQTRIGWQTPSLSHVPSCDASGVQEAPSLTVSTQPRPGSQDEMWHSSLGGGQVIGPPETQLRAPSRAPEPVHASPPPQSVPAGFGSCV